MAVCRCGLRADEQAKRARYARGLGSKTCQYAAVTVLPPVHAHLSCAKTFTALCRQAGESPSRNAHAQHSPKSGNWRHSSTQAHREEAASQVRSEHAQRPSLYKWAPIRNFLRRSHRLVVRARDASGDESNNEQRAGEIRVCVCVCAYCCSQSMTVGRSSA